MPAFIDFCDPTFVSVGRQESQQIARCRASDGRTGGRTLHWLLQSGGARPKTLEARDRRVSAIRCARTQLFAPLGHDYLCRQGRITADDQPAVEMTTPWTAQNAAHRAGEIARTTREPHIFHSGLARRAGVIGLTASTARVTHQK
jgi:hypothetical protein